MLLAHLTVVVSTLVGWGDVSIAPSRGDRVSSLQRSLAGLDRPSERTIETLKRYDLERTYRRNVDHALAALEKIARAHAEPEVVYALAELSWIEGLRLDRWRKAAAIDRFLDAVAYSYDFLMDPDLAHGRQPSDPRFVLACKLYNGGLERLIRAAQSDGKIMPEGTITLKVHGREQVLRVALQNSPWSSRDVDQVILASDFKVSGLNSQTYQDGLGVPLIGIHRSEEPGKEGREKFYPPEMAFALTAFLKPNSRLRDPDKGNAPRECTLLLVDPISIHRVGAAPTEMPVEADLSTPLAFMWSRTDLDRYRWTGLFRPGAAMHRANLMLLRPYEPGKIPVVMVHGLISSPLAWVAMINDLLRDPVIHEKYQFMLYMYPTGVPIPVAEAGLRDTLLQAKQMYDPGGADPAFEQMVLLGHSMGGLLSHMTAVQSDDRLWRLNSVTRFNDIIGPPEVLDALHGYFFFEPLPFVRRVVFLATPHRGSDLSRNVIGRLSTNLIVEPDHITDLLNRLLKDNPDAFDRRQFRRMPTSIETLDTDSPFLLALLSMKPGPGVAFHSIIGADHAGPVDRSTDGIVPYRSAHMDGVASELIVRSNHGVQTAPLAIQEVRRILLEHVGASLMPAQTAGAPASARRLGSLPVENDRR
jgi:pimeloyl-ACP methyl ester carboxylesterase